MRPVRLGLIGLGRWGRRYVETIGSMENVKLAFAVGSQFADDAFYDMVPHVDGVILATGPESHCELAVRAAGAGVPVMIEKPLSLRVEDVEVLAEASRQSDVPMLVNHGALFSSVYQDAKRVFTRDMQIDMDWLGPGRHNYSPLYDYGAHAVAVALDLMSPSEPTKIECETIATDAVFEIRMRFRETTVRVSIGCSDIRNRVLRLYGSHGVSGGAIAEGTPPPLRCALDAFVRTIQGEPDPRVGLDLALRVTRILAECARQVSL